MTKEVNKAIEMLNYLKNMNGCYPDTMIAYRILLTISVTIGSVERSFSKLKLIKTHLRSTMSQEMLNGLAMLSIEKGSLENVIFEKSVNDLANNNATRIIFEI